MNSFKFLLCLRKLELRSFLKSMSCLSPKYILNLEHFHHLHTSALTCPKPPLSLALMNATGSHLLSLAPDKPLSTPEGQLILDKCQSNDVTSSDFSLHPYSYPVLRHDLCLSTPVKQFVPPPIITVLQLHCPLVVCFSDL